MKTELDFLPFAPLGVNDPSCCDSSLQAQNTLTFLHRRLVSLFGPFQSFTLPVCFDVVAPVPAPVFSPVHRYQPEFNLELGQGLIPCHGVEVSCVSY